jgi:hypothetical protein
MRINSFSATFISNFQMPGMGLGLGGGAGGIGANPLMAAGLEQLDKFGGFGCVGNALTNHMMQAAGAAALHGLARGLSMGAQPGLLGSGAGGCCGGAGALNPFGANALGGLGANPFAAHAMGQLAGQAIAANAMGQLAGRALANQALAGQALMGNPFAANALMANALGGGMGGLGGGMGGLGGGMGGMGGLGGGAMGGGRGIPALPAGGCFEDLVSAFMIKTVKKMQDEAKAKMNEIKAANQKGKGGGGKGGGGGIGGAAKGAAGGGGGAKGAGGGGGGDDSRNLKFEELKNIMQKVQQMQQALSNVLNTMHQGAMNSIRNIKA